MNKAEAQQVLVSMMPNLAERDTAEVIATAIAHSSDCPLEAMRAGIDALIMVAEGHLDDLGPGEGGDLQFLIDLAHDLKMARGHVK